MNVKHWLGCGVLLLAAILLIAYLFRTETYENPELGIIENRFRWGYAFEQTADVNRDGNPDYRAIYAKGARSFSTGQAPVEIWEDRDYDRKFEIHAVLDESIVVTVEIDKDGDGVYETILSGEEASSFFKKEVGGQGH